MPNGSPLKIQSIYSLPASHDQQQWSPEVMASPPETLVNSEGSFTTMTTESAQDKNYNQDGTVEQEVSSSTTCTTGVETTPYGTAELTSEAPLNENRQDANCSKLACNPVRGDEIIPETRKVQKFQNGSVEKSLENSRFVPLNKDGQGSGELMNHSRSVCDVEEVDEMSSAFRKGAKFQNGSLERSENMIPDEWR